MLMENSGTRNFENEYDFTKDDFDDIARLALKHFGLSLPETKIPLVYSRLTRRLRALGIKKFSDYRRLLASQDGHDERQELLSALTTNVTHFFREMHHFEQLSGEVLPRLIEVAKSGGRVRIWSAGCSTGPEPYSIAMTVLEKFPEAAMFDFKILATDIDPVVVEKAISAKYLTSDLESIPVGLRSANNFLGVGNEKVISDRVRNLVSFRVLNLIEPFPFAGSFDVIFCRNVAIYFDKPTQQAVWSKLCHVLRADGTLFIGHSERISGPALDVVKSIGVTAYRKL